MKKKAWVFFGLLVALATTALVLSSCGHYVCGHTFGASTCTATGKGFGSGGSGGSSSAFVFAVDQQGTADGFALDTSASTFGAISGFSAPTIPQNDFGVGMVVAQKKFLYTGFGASSPNQLFGWSIDSSTGALTKVNGSPYAAPFLGFVGASGFPQLSMITNPAGTLLFIADAGNAQIWVYQIGGDGSLQAASGSPFSTGTFQPFNMTTDGLGKYLYATDVISTHEGIGGIAAYSINSSNGKLTPLANSPFVFPTPMWAVQGEPSGKYLIGTSGKTALLAGTDDKNLYVFSINQSTGALTLNGTFPTTNAPFSIAVSPVATNGTFVYSFGIESTGSTGTGFNPIEGYSISSTGTLTSVGTFSNVQLGSWGQFDQSGTLLFDYSQIQNLGTGTITAQMGAFSVASSGAITQIGSALTLGTPGYWAVTDTQ
jgi:6-phosphogluconolactonase (cycloisomerase 2 family)